MYSYDCTETFVQLRLHRYVCTVMIVQFYMYSYDLPL